MCERDGCRERLSARHSHRARFCSTRCRVAAHRARQVVEPPAALRRRDRWVRRSALKEPLRADRGVLASVRNPSTWSSYREAAASPHGMGLGYVLAAGDGVVCIDLDHCLDGSGRLAAWARAILDRCPPTFVEVSPGGHGLHVWGRGEVARGRRIRRADGAHIEVYGQGRYIAMSGRRYENAPRSLADLSEVIASLT